MKCSKTKANQLQMRMKKKAIKFSTLSTEGHRTIEHNIIRLDFLFSFSLQHLNFCQIENEKLLQLKKKWNRKTKSILTSIENGVFSFASHNVHFDIKLFNVKSEIQSSIFNCNILPLINLCFSILPTDAHRFTRKESAISIFYVNFQRNKTVEMIQFEQWRRKERGKDEEERRKKQREISKSWFRRIIRRTMEKLQRKKWHEKRNSFMLHFTLNWHTERNRWHNERNATQIDHDFDFGVASTNTNANQWNRSMAYEGDDSPSRRIDAVQATEKKQSTKQSEEATAFSEMDFASRHRSILSSHLTVSEFRSRNI